MDKKTEKTVLKIAIGFILVLVLALGSLLVSAIMTNEYTISEEEAISKALGLADGEEDDERVELIEQDMDGALDVPLPSRYAAEGVVAPEGAPVVDASEEEPVVELQVEITEDEAKAIELKEVPGKVMDAGIEKYQGKLAYVIEVDADDGPETDVFIDKDTGEVLGTET